MINHYRDIADAVDIPIILYNVPGRTAQNIEPDQIEEMARHPNIAAVKEASGDINQISRICSRTRDMDFDVVSGDDSMTHPIISVGGTGVISVAANIVPEQVVDLTHSLLEGNFDRGTELHHELMRLFDSMFIESNPIPVKIAMEELGYCSSELRPPLSNDVPNSSREEIIETLNRYI